MRKFFSRIERKRLSGIAALALVLLLVSVGVFGFGHGASAGLLDWSINLGATTLAALAGGLVGWLVQTIGWMLLNFIWVLLAVGNYNQFLASTAVTTGWVVVRDFVNMFFVLVLLAIAIGTILQQQNYHYSQTLPKFLAAAILVNFSKTICGIAIDAAQVVMMTFMGAISAAGGGNFAVLIGLHGLLKTIGERANPFSGTEAATGMLLAFFYVVVAFIVVVIMVVMLVIRIVALWFLIILSPAAFFLMSLPNDRGYFSKWLEQFTNYLLLGPVMAFFLWLSLTVVAANQEGINDGSQIYIASELGLELSDKPGWAGEKQFGDLGGSMIGTLGGTAGYLLGIAMLMGSLMAAQQLASVGGNVAGAGAAFAKDWMVGKRGPFSPFRGLRETVSGVMARREERRKERVKERVRFADEALGVIQGMPRGAARGLGRWAMATGPGRRAREIYGSEAVQRSMAFLQFGSRFQEEMGRNRREHQGAATRLYDNAGEERRRAKNSRILAEERRAQETTVRANMTQPGLSPVQQAAMQVTADRLAADATRLDNEAAGLEADAGGHEGQAQGHELRALVDGIRMGLPRVAGEIIRAGLASATAPIGGAVALYGPQAVNAVGREGDAVVLEARQAQSSAIKERANKQPKEDFERLIGLLHSTKPGAEADLDRQAAAYNLMDPQHKENLSNNDIEQVRRFYSRGAIGEDAREMFEGRVAEVRHTEVEGGLTDMRLEQLLRSNKIDMKKATPDMADLQLIRVISHLPAHIAHAITKDAPAPVRNAIRDRSQELLGNLEVGGVAPRDGQGRITQGYAEVLRTFANAGGDTSQLFGFDANGNVAPGRPAGALGINDLQQIITADLDDDPTVAHLADLMPQVLLSLNAGNLANSANFNHRLQGLLGNLVTVNQLNSLRRGAQEGTSRHKNNMVELLRMFETLKDQLDRNPVLYNGIHGQIGTNPGIRDRRITIGGLRQRRQRSEQTI